MSPVHLALYWHQHQPFYYDIHAQRSRMPWVRLHATKDYYGMARLAQEAAESGFPVKMTINLVPSLIAQLQAYIDDATTDPHLELCRKHPDDMSPQERAQMLDLLFQANWDHMIRVHPRYAELLQKRRPGKIPATHLTETFKPQELLDLQVWANLVWFHRTIVEADEPLRELIAKDRGFTVEERDFVLRRQREVMAEVLPLHRKLQDEGLVEITTSPFYHPILPLLCNMESAHVAMPRTGLPDGWRPLVDDARAQLKKAVVQYEKVFGRRPQGLWPSEGSVSPEILPLVAEQGFEWLATDEAILALSVGVSFHRDAHGNVVHAGDLYQPYHVKTPHGKLAMVFRDHGISDMVGFDFQYREPGQSASDFLNRIREVKHRAGDGALVPVILDGENCWEYYRDGGLPFLRTLYREIARSNDVRTVRLGDRLREYPPKRSIEKLYSGSWINHDFYIWIGHYEDVRGWEYLFRVRDDLVRWTREMAGEAAGKERLSRAWESFYAAEGSDWFWWYGDDHSSGQDEVFDEIFRTHLQNVYRFLDQPIPGYLNVPVQAIEKIAAAVRPSALLSVVVDGRLTHYFEWLAAGRYQASPNEGRTAAGGTMARASAAAQQSAALLEEIRYGFDLDRLFIMLAPVASWRQILQTTNGDVRLRVQFTAPHETMLEVRDLTGDPQLKLGHEDAKRLKTVDKMPTTRKTVRRFEDAPDQGRTVAVDDVVEMAVPFASLNFKPQTKVSFFVEIVRDGTPVERLPGVEVLNFVVPSPQFEGARWLV